MLTKTTLRKMLSLKPPVSPIAADIEYRLVWSEIRAQWEIHRNGARTSASPAEKTVGAR